MSVYRHRRGGLCYIIMCTVTEDQIVFYVCVLSQSKWSLLHMCTVTARRGGGGGGGGSDTRWVKGEAVTSSFVAVVVLHDQY